MAAPELGPWEPLSVMDAADCFRAASFRWWVSGGRALELHFGRSWREHDDTDIGVVRRDVVALRSVLDSWDIQVAAGGRLEPWKGEELRAEASQNNLWCRRHPDGPWLLDITIGEGDRDAWIYRRNPQVRVPWNDAVLNAPGDIPYLAPELQLLFKSKDHREKDDTDALQVIPELDTVRRDWLRRLLPEADPWQTLLASR